MGNKAKGPKQDSLNGIRPSVPKGGEPFYIFIDRFILVYSVPGPMLSWDNDTCRRPWVKEKTSLTVFIPVSHILTFHFNTWCHKTDESCDVSMWSWSYGSWFYNYLCNQCISPLTLWVWIALMTRCARYNLVIQIVSNLWQVSGFLRVLRFAPRIKLKSRYNWNIVESGAKHHNSNAIPYK